MLKNEFWFELFDSKEIQEIFRFQSQDRFHPLQRVMFPERCGGQKVQIISENTIRAISYGLDHNREWILGLKKRLLNSKDFNHASSALGEIRAYGSLIASGVNVNPISTTSVPTPEFRCEINGERFIIEVLTKQMKEEETKELREFKNSSKQAGTPGFRYHDVVPFGRPREGESVTSNSISKLCAIKEKEHQFSEEEICLLWMDFQDESMDTIFSIENARSYNIFRGEVTSGALWYAFYGWKGAPIFESHLEEKFISVPPIAMKHDGRFRTTKKLRGAIASFAEATVIYENPFLVAFLPQQIKLCLSMLQGYHKEYSILSCNETNILSEIEESQKILLNMTKRYRYRTMHKYY